MHRGVPAAPRNHFRCRASARPMRRRTPGRCSMSSERKKWKRAANEGERLERRRASRRKWRQTHWLQILADQRRRRRTDPVYLEKERARRRKSERKRLLETVYGITVEQYEDMVARQHGRCGICERRPKGSLCVDHCHAPRQLRRLLCRNCNSRIRFAFDAPVVLELAADYLLSTTELVANLSAPYERKRGALRRHHAQRLDKRAVLKRRCET